MASGQSVYLVGFMCSGKTTVGRLLARELEWRFIDLDELIADRAGATVAEIFSDRGEDEFRRLESDALAGIAGTRAVVATGGGIVLSPSNRRLLRETGFVLWLRAELALLLERARTQQHAERPLWRDEGTLAVMLRHREPFYELADKVFDTAREEPQMVARTLACAVREWMDQR